MKLRLVGDVHQNIPEYIKTIKDCDYSIQLGDLGFNYKFLYSYQVDQSKHTFFPGNHDNYGATFPVHSLGDWGKHPRFPNIFFVRGAWSIDQIHRRPGFDWWPEEQLTTTQLMNAILDYEVAKPEIMLSHECPFSVIDQLGLRPEFALTMGHKTHIVETRTSLALQQMFEFHQPKLWVFGHYHKDFDKVINGTRFVCVTMDPNLRHCSQRFLDVEV